MAKPKAKNVAKNPGSPLEKVNPVLADLRQDLILWYKIHVLIYDLCNIREDRTSQLRILQTTDELYISSPYFTPSESSLIKSTLVEKTAEDDAAVEPIQTIEEAIKERLAGFFGKRQASGDFRPCGPHDMVPIYEKTFGIDHSELKD